MFLNVFGLVFFFTSLHLLECKTISGAQQHQSKDREDKSQNMVKWI